MRWASMLLLAGCATPAERRADVGLVSADQKQAVLALKAGLESAPREAVNKAEVRLVANQRNEAVTRGFTLVQDEPERVGGGGRGPTPTDFFVAAVGFCENVVFVRNAALLDLGIDGLETSVSGNWEMQGLFGIGGADAGFKTITIETRVTTRDPVAKVVEAARLTHRDCPLHATLRKSVELVFRLVVNGQPVAL